MKAFVSVLQNVVIEMDESVKSRRRVVVIIVYYFGGSRGLSGSIKLIPNIVVTTKSRTGAKHL